jgi:hypothetical protein
MKNKIIPFLAYTMLFLMIWGMISMNNDLITISFLVGYFSAMIGSKGKKGNEENPPNNACCSIEEDTENIQ